MTHPVYRDPRWRKIRTFILERDEHTCQIQLPGCTHTATEADHILEFSQGGDPYHPDNLRASCKHCNVSRRNRRTATRKQQQRHSRNW